MKSVCLAVGRLFVHHCNVLQQERESSSTVVALTFCCSTVVCSCLCSCRAVCRTTTLEGESEEREGHSSAGPSYVSDEHRLSWRCQSCLRSMHGVCRCCPAQLLQQQALPGWIMHACRAATPSSCGCAGVACTSPATACECHGVRQRPASLAQASKTHKRHVRERGRECWCAHKRRREVLQGGTRQRGTRHEWLERHERVRA